jgi:DNA-nicking Smr family endonuclease
MSKRPASDDHDADDFAKAMADIALVKPMKADPRGRVHATASATRAPTPRAVPLPAPKPVASDLDEAIDGAWLGPGVDRRELRKLRRGDHAPVRRLDLHGLSGAAAVARVKLFEDGARASCRCVAIVHGRGLRSTDNVAVLKPRVRECLTKHPGVLAFADAPRTDGGDGAVYVLLKKT